MSTDFLRNHAQTLGDFARETAERAAQNPSDFWLRMAAENQTQAAQDAERDLSLDYAEQVGELLDLRFVGPTANGSIALDAFVRIAEPLSKAWQAAAYRIRHGVPQGRGGGEIADTLNLKLAGIAHGSTRILVTGDAATDLAGESLLHATLVQTFRLLRATNDEFYDAVDAIGGRSAEYFGEAMKALGRAGLSVEFSWRSPIGHHVWHGSSEDVLRIRTLLDAVVAPEVYEEEINGFVAGIVDTGRLELRTREGHIHIRFPLDLTGKVQKLPTQKAITIHVSTTKYWDAAAKKDVVKRWMIDVLA
jgi:hypothetical protein